MADDNGPAGGTPLANPVWDAWPPAEIARRLAGVRAHWYVAGGWALDLFRGKQQRDHDDLEIAVPAARFGAVRAALRPAAAGWLRDALARIHPGHAWLGAL
jgi:Aminoglycoside-2''-adenylyltransferase